MSWTLDIEFFWQLWSNLILVVPGTSVIGRLSRPLSVHM
jgi:hypothetical protein